MEKLSKIFFVMNPDRGGGPRNVFTISKLLNDDDYNSKIIAFNSNNYVEWFLGIAKNHNFYGAKRVVNTNLFSLIDSFTSFSDNLSWAKLPLFIFQQNFTRPIILSKHEIPDIYIATNWQSYEPTLKISRVFHRKMAYFVQAEETEFSRIEIYKREVMKTYIDDTPKFTQSKWLVDKFRDKFGVELTHIGLGLDHSVFYPRKLERKNVIFTIARTELTKGFSMFVRSINRLWKKRKDFTVIIAGSSNAFSLLELNFPFQFLGWIQDDNTLAELYSTSIFVNTGVNETLAMPPLEAMSCGGTVIMTANGGAIEYIKDRENCLIVEVGNDSELTDKLDETLSDNDLRDSLKIGALKTASYYNWEDCLRNFLAFLDDRIRD